MSSWTVDWEDLLYLKTTRKKPNYLVSLLETSLLGLFEGDGPHSLYHHQS